MRPSTTDGRPHGTPGGCPPSGGPALPVDGPALPVPPVTGPALPVPPVSGPALPGAGPLPEGGTPGRPRFACWARLPRPRGGQIRDRPRRGGQALGFGHVQHAIRRFEPQVG